MRVLIEKMLIVLLGLLWFSINGIPNNQLITLLFCCSASLFVELTSNDIAKWIGVTLLVMVHLFIPTSYMFIPLTIYTLVHLIGYKGLASNVLLFIFPSIQLILLASLATHLAWHARKEVEYHHNSLTIQDKLNADKLNLRRKQMQLEQEQIKNIEIATLAERNRIAHQLHDSIGHVISSSILQLEAMQITTTDQATQQQLSILSTVLQNGMTDIRENLHNLYGESFHLKYRMEEVLRGLIHQQVNFHYAIETPLDISLKVDMLSIVKELVANCQKHSNASEVHIYVLEQPNVYTIHYRDDGNRMHKQPPMGIGLMAMEETVRKYNGTLSVQTENGFQVHVTIKKQLHNSFTGQDERGDIE